MDETTSPVYSADDIRLCTMHRATRDQSFGLMLRYHRHEGFHYVTLLGDPRSNAAYSAGVRNFDRLIEFNGIHIETDSADALSKRMNEVDTLNLQLLVCSPATYMHYKANGVPLHRHLGTVNSKLFLVGPFPTIVCLSDLSYSTKLACVEDDALFLTAYQEPITILTHQRTEEKCFLEISMRDIELRGELGHGAFGKSLKLDPRASSSYATLLGTVYEGKWLSKNRRVACKVINATPDRVHLEHSFRKELEAYAKLTSPDILEIYGYNIQEVSASLRKCTLIMEYMHRGSLSAVLKQDEKLCLRCKHKMACQIVNGMKELHEHGMIHRDIRPENILVAHDYTAKIADMGLAREWLPDVDLTLIGCLPYMPLEFYTSKYGPSLDVFTFGLTINVLFTEVRHKFNILDRSIELVHRSPVFADVIDECLQKEPSQRPSAANISMKLCKYKEEFERFLCEQHVGFDAMTMQDQDTYFIRICANLKHSLNDV